MILVDTYLVDIHWKDKLVLDYDTMNMYFVDIQLVDMLLTIKMSWT